MDKRKFFTCLSASARSRSSFSLLEDISLISWSSIALTGLLKLQCCDENTRIWLVNLNDLAILLVKLTLDTSVLKPYIIDKLARFGFVLKRLRSNLWNYQIFSDKMLFDRISLSTRGLMKPSLPFQPLFRRYAVTEASSVAKRTLFTRSRFPSKSSNLIGQSTNALDRMITAGRCFSTQSRSGGILYNTFFKTNSRYLLFVFTGAVIGEAIYGFVFDTIWELNNKGVRKICIYTWEKFLLFFFSLEVVQGYWLE